MTKILRIDEFVKVNARDFTTTTTDDVYRNDRLNSDKDSPFRIIKNAVTDIDGNRYDGIEINGKVWMASNLMTTRFNDGTEIGRFADSEKGKLPYFEYPGKLHEGSSELKDYGLLYNFEAVDTGNLAPEGWHVPTIGEFKELLAFIAEDKRFNLEPDKKDPFGAYIAKSLCSKTGWDSDSETDAVGNDQSLNNLTGFNWFPAGYWYPAGSTSRNYGYYTSLWSCSPNASSADNAWYVRMNYSYANVSQYADSRIFGFSVRCVRD